MVLFYMKGLPTDIGTFSNLINDGYLYVDKTKYIYEFVKPNKKYFLSRPRRFGKSLLVSTLEELFKGNKDLFKDLYIYDKWDWNKTHPIVHIDLGKGKYKSLLDVEDSLDDIINRIARYFNVELNSKNISGKVTDLIDEIYKKEGKVVVLVDEYDKPIMDNIKDLKLADEIRETLNSFYGSFKSSDKLIEFFFITGVTKFSKTSIFSGLNNVSDLTLQCPLICGYTQEELETCFGDRLLKFAEDENVSLDCILDLIKQRYNGYSYNGEDFLYNPYSILSLLSTKEFSNFWFKSGTPSFLMNLLSSGNLDLDVLLNPNPVITEDIPNFDLKHLDFTTILLQTGYLTIKKKSKVLGKPSKYTLGIPNQEVHESLYNYILAYYTNKTPQSIPSIIDKITEALVKLDEEKIEAELNLILSNISHRTYDKIKKDIGEANYHMVIHAVLQSLGFDIESEVTTHKGIIDAIIKIEDIVIIVEFKNIENSSYDYMIKEAFKSIIDKDYYKPYINKKVVLLAVAIKDRECKCKCKFKTLN